ncbi:MAG: RNA-binding protein [Candidatus Microthrix sp.]|uniref:RNA-binding protein n=1 Tax=Candidatus Neomicrothrix subdominans TaxID=2954438 RepID=A0A936NA07_9ACTN|nr:RNA-binding protein [Candidatus Microthrix subdominans]
MAEGQSTPLWVIDGNNVMGSAADGWWNDPSAAAARLAERVGRWARSIDAALALVFDGSPDDAISAAAAATSKCSMPDGRAGTPDDRIVEEVEARYGDHPETTVVTSDRGLIGRLPRVCS